MAFFYLQVQVIADNAEDHWLQTAGSVVASAAVKQLGLETNLAEGESTSDMALHYRGRYTGLLLAFAWLLTLCTKSTNRIVRASSRCSSLRSLAPTYTSVMRQTLVHVCRPCGLPERARIRNLSSTPPQGCLYGYALIYRAAALGTPKSPVDGHDGQHVRLLRCQSIWTDYVPFARTWLGREDLL